MHVHLEMFAVILVVAAVVAVIACSLVCKDVHPDRSETLD